MSKLFLMDTSAWIVSFRQPCDINIKSSIEALLSERRIVSCGIIMLELLRGVVSEAEYKKLFNDLNALDFVEITPRVWQASYKIAFEMKRKGNLIPTADCLIAALVIESNLKLIHADQHFSIIQKFTPLEEINILNKINIE